VADREKELALLTGAVADVRAGRGRAVLIEGEAGVGKSALLAVLLGPGSINPPVDAGAGRCRVIQAVCDELAQRFPLSAVTQALSLSGLDVGGGAGRSAAAEVSWGTGDPVLGAVEELLGFVHRLCAERPLILALEDMHWADEASVLLWRRLCRVTTQLPLLLIGTRRPLPRGAPLERDVASRGGIVITLAGLTATGVAQMAADLTGGTPGPRLLHWLEPAAGNPFYVRELLDAALRSGAVQEISGQAELTEAAGAANGLSSRVTSLQQAIAGRLDFLSPTVLHILRIAALLGPDFPVTDLAAVTGHTATTLLPHVEDAIAAGLLEETGPRLRFRHGLLQQALYEGMPTPVRAGLHRQAAQTLITLTAPAERITRHLLALPDLGEDWETDWLTHNAANLAGRVPEVASTLLEQILGQLSPHDPRQATLADRRTDALFTLGRFEQVAQLTAALGPGAADPDRYGHLTWTRAYALLSLRRPFEAVAVLRDAMEHPGTSAVWQARFLALQAILLTTTGPAGEADRVADAALATATRLGDPAALAYARHARSTRHFFAQEFTAALDLIDQALPLTASDPQLTDLRLLLIYNRVDLTGELGRFDEALTLARQTLTAYELSGSPRLSVMRAAAAGLAYETGRWDDVVAELEAVTETEDRSGELHGLQALIAGHREDWAGAEEHLDTLRRQARQDAAVVRSRAAPKATVEMALALAGEAAGDVTGAVRALAAWLDPERGSKLPFRYKLLPTLTRLALEAGDETTARAAAQAARAETDQEPRVWRQAAVRWCDGLVTADPAAVRAAAQALRELGLPLYAGNALEDAAVGFAQAGDTSTGRAVLDEALASYAPLGATWDARRAAARIRPHGVRPGVRSLRRRPQTGWQSLTSTETQVAQLLAEGRSNPDIATQLFISRRTVESHVSHILAKLQLTSRWEVRAAAE